MGSKLDQTAYEVSTCISPMVWGNVINLVVATTRDTARPQVWDHLGLQNNVGRVGNQVREGLNHGEARD